MSFSNLRGVLTDDQPTSLETGECHMETQKFVKLRNGRLEIPKSDSSTEIYADK